MILNYITLTLCTLSIEPIDFYFSLTCNPSFNIMYNEIDNTIELEIDSDFNVYLETNDYSDYSVYDDEYIASFLNSIFIDLDTKSINEVDYYEINYNFDVNRIGYTLDYFYIDAVIKTDFYLFFNDSTSEHGYAEIPFNYLDPKNFNDGNQFFSYIYPNYMFRGILEENYTKSIYDEGFENGVIVGKREEPIYRLFNAIFTVIDNTLSVEVLPGIKLWYGVGVVLFFSILQFFLNLWR